MKLSDAIDTQEGVMLRLVKGEKAIKLTFSEHNDISTVFNILFGEFEDLGEPTEERPFRYYKEVHFFERDEELPIKIDIIVNKGNHRA